jgi:fructose-1-phosphate kinase PfkB-like protein
MLPHRSIHKYTWTPPDGNIHNQIDHILIGEDIQVYFIRLFRAADCDTDHYRVVAKIRERIAVNERGSHRFHMARFNLKKLNEAEGKVKYRVEVSNRFGALEDLDAEVQINTIWETIRQNIKISAKRSLGYYEMKKH